MDLLARPSFSALFAATTVLFAATTATAQQKPQTYEITVVETKAQPVLVMKGTEDYKKSNAAIKGTLAKVEAYLKEKKITATGAPFSRTLLFKQNLLEFEAGYPVATGQNGEGDVYSTTLPAAKVAKTVHTGPLDKSIGAYNALHAWMGKNKKRTAGQPWEVYAAPSKLEVFYPIKDKK